MEYGLLLFLAVALGAGVGGGLLSAWSCHRRILALEENLKIVLVALEDRVNQLTKIVVRQDKTEAAKARWSGKKAEDEALAKVLTQPDPMQPALHPWDPRTWGAK